jgi:hypothetical protein
LTLELDEIVKLIEDYDKESRALRAECLKMCWYMRGGITYDEAIMLSQAEREIISGLIKENMETTKKSGLPFF